MYAVIRRRTVVRTFRWHWAASLFAGFGNTFITDPAFGPFYTVQVSEGNK